MTGVAEENRDALVLDGVQAVCVLGGGMNRGKTERTKLDEVNSHKQSNVYLENCLG